MMSGRLVAALLLTAMLLSAGHAVGGLDNPGSPQYANRILSNFQTPTVAPGQTVHFAFNLTNPYVAGMDIYGPMFEVRLVVGIYMYATQEKTVRIDSAFQNPPRFDGIGPETMRNVGSVKPGASNRTLLSIETSERTPHGSYFSQSTYFVRFSLTFEVNSIPVVLKSKGWFNDTEWNRIVSFQGNEPIVNMNVLKNDFGVDGLLPDSSFGIKIPIPRWPLAVIIAGGVGLSLLAVSFYTLDNPGKYPKLEKRLYQLRGKLGELRGKLKHSRGK